MIFISAEDIQNNFTIKSLIEEIESVYKKNSKVPVRQIHNIDYLECANDPSQLILMPAFLSEEDYGIKLLNVFPSNTLIGLSRVKALFILFDSKNGKVKAVLDGTELTNQRTAAMSAIASKFLSKFNSKKLLVLGTGALVPYMIKAHCFVRPIEEVLIWGRDYSKVKNIVHNYKNNKIKITIVENLEKACGEADIITSLTSAKKEFIMGSWLNKNVHIDLVGAHTKLMAELDPYGFSLGNIYVDNRSAVLEEAGDLINAINLGFIKNNNIKADIQELIKNNKLVRDKRSEVTIYKSVGYALSDLAAARLAFRCLRPS